MEGTFVEILYHPSPGQRVFRGPATECSEALPQSGSVVAYGCEIQMDGCKYCLCAVYCNKEGKPAS